MSVHTAELVTAKEPADPDGIFDVATIERIAPSMYEVVSWSGNTYTVDLENPACQCRDFERRERVCKHIIRAKVTDITVNEVEQ